MNTWDPLYSQSDLEKANLEEKFYTEKLNDKDLEKAKKRWEEIKKTQETSGIGEYEGNQVISVTIFSDFSVLEEVNMETGDVTYTKTNPEFKFKAED